MNAIGEMNDFKKELEKLINAHSIDNLTNTPDFILAEYLVGMINEYRKHESLIRTWKETIEQSSCQG